MSSDSEATISRRISQRSETETESEAFVLPQTEKLPQLDQFDPNFEELHDVPEDYKDPIRVHKMLIDERMEKIRNQSEFANLEEEFHRLKGDLDDQKRKKVDFIDQTLTQAEKDEIERLQRELTSTKRNLQELEEREAAVAFELHGGPGGHDQTGHLGSAGLGPDYGLPIPPAEIEMVRAAVIHENKTKYNFESLRTIEAEIEKYRNLYNDVRSKFTILCGDYEHLKLEHKDEIDSTRYRHHIDITALIAERDNFKIQNEEIKKYSINEIDLMKHEITQLNAKKDSLKIEKDTIDERRRDLMKQIDSDNHERERKMTEIEQDLANERAENKRLQSLVENRESEIAKSQSENRQLKSQIESLKRNAAEAQRISDSEDIKFKNQLVSIQATFEMEISNSKIELEKWKSAYRKMNDELTKEKKNSEKRSKMAEEAEVTAAEKINEVKTENWAIIEKLRSEKRETDSLYQKETDKKNKIESDLELLRDQIKAEKLEWERTKMRLENQATATRDEKVRLHADLKEAQIKNEQITELKRSIEADQKDKTELVRQMHERDLAIKEASLIKDNLNVEISALRQELQLSLEEAKRNRENDRISHLEENNRLNQRIDQLEGRNQQLQDKVTKSAQDNDSIKKKYSSKLKSVNDDNLMLKAEKEKLKSELELTSKTKGVSREEYEKVKRRAEVMRKRMANFALAINAGVIPNTSLDSIDMTLSPQKMPSYSLSKTDSMSMVDLSQINRRLDQIELDQLKQVKVFKENQNTKQ